jgi:hypothetical protein
MASARTPFQVHSAAVIHSLSACYFRRGLGPVICVRIEPLPRRAAGLQATLQLPCSVGVRAGMAQKNERRGLRHPVWPSTLIVKVRRNSLRQDQIHARWPDDKEGGRRNRAPNGMWPLSAIDHARGVGHRRVLRTDRVFDVDAIAGEKAAVS